MSLRTAFASLTIAATALLALAGCGIEITAPDNGEVVQPGETVRFKAVRRLGASAIHDIGWTSSIDGDLGTGDEILVPDAAAGSSPLSTGDHTITAQQQGVFSWHSWRDSIRLAVGGCVPAASDVATGSPGQIRNGQSYNETRAVDVTLLGTSDRIVEELILEGLNAAAPVTVGARIYNGATQALVASAEIGLGTGSNMTVTVPITATLRAGNSYRIGFYVETNPRGRASGNMWASDNFSSLGGPIPYNEDSGVFRVNSAHSIGSDAFPANPNIFAPQLTIRTRC